MEDPKGTLEQELGRRLREEVQVRAVEETADTIYLVLPSASIAGREGGALSEQELESVAGGSSGDISLDTGYMWVDYMDSTHEC
jgi:hypothetical protein